MDNPNSAVERVAFRGKETATHLLTADNLSVRTSAEGGIVLELFRYNDTTQRAVESYRFLLCPEDVTRLKAELRI